MRCSRREFLGNITTRGQVQPNVGGLRYENLWDQLTPENETKWGSIANKEVQSVDEALSLTNKAVMEALDGLPPVKVHCLPL